MITHVKRQMCEMTVFGREELIGTPFKRFDEATQLDVADAASSCALIERKRCVRRDLGNACGPAVLAVRVERRRGEVGNLVLRRAQRP